MAEIRPPSSDEARGGPAAKDVPRRLLFRKQAWSRALLVYLRTPDAAGLVSGRNQASDVWPGRRLGLVS